jgi:predicted transcriptional regulator
MHTDYHASNAERKPDLELEYHRELKKLSDIGFVFLFASDGDPAQAESLLDDFIDLVFEGGALSTWRYRILLAQIREGL